jgi:membrane-associated protein
VSTLVGWFENHAYLLVFVTVTLELVGVPFPSETILIGAGAAAAGTSERAAGDGGRGDRGDAGRAGRIRDRADRRAAAAGPAGGARLAAAAAVLRVEEFFGRHGGKSLVGARFVPFVRSSRPGWRGGGMPLRHFAAWNVVGAVAWV